MIRNEIQSDWKFCSLTLLLNDYDLPNLSRFSINNCLSIATLICASLNEDCLYFHRSFFFGGGRGGSVLRMLFKFSLFLVNFLSWSINLLNLIVKREIIRKRIKQKMCKNEKSRKNKSERGEREIIHYRTWAVLESFSVRIIYIYHFVFPCTTFSSLLSTV